MTRRLYLVRHGAAEGAEGRAIGHTDLPLSASGRRAIERLTASWMGPPPDRLITSPLTRAGASAEILGAKWNLIPSTEPRLAEMSFGIWDGRSWDEIHVGDGERFAAWATHWWQAPTPGGEGFPGLIARTGEWLDSELAERSPRVTVAVTHAGPIRALLGGRLGVPVRELWEQQVGLARVSAVAAGRHHPPRLLFVDRPGFPAPSAIRADA
ncbi:MAG TPA: histidine phosphatase family protein [Thermoanaerobaculia bacterium]|nr:histidine phosphatase family protein [Thermoanaerobaculia bacterium]